MVFETNGNTNKIPQTGFPLSSVVPSSILCQPVLYVIPDRGQVVSLQSLLSEGFEAQM